MAALAADAVHTWSLDPTETVDYEGVLTNKKVYVNAILEKTGLHVQPYDGTGTADFAGISRDNQDATGVTSGDLKVGARKRGRVRTSLNTTVAALDEGKTVYANNDNLADCDYSSTGSLPIGKVARVILAGTAGANEVEISIAADGIQGV